MDQQEAKDIGSFARSRSVADSGIEATLAACIERTNVDVANVRELEEHVKTPYALVSISRTDGTPLEDCLVAGEGAVVAHVAGSAYALVASEELAQFTKNVADSLRKPQQYSIAVSLPFNSAMEIATQAELLAFCTKTRGPGIHDAKDCALAFVVSRIKRDKSIGFLLHPALEKLKAYDAANQSDLYNTLKVYLLNDRNAQRCASMLYLHRNSLQYRVKRIQEITGVDLNDETERTYLGLSFLLK